MSESCERADVAEGGGLAGNGSSDWDGAEAFCSGLLETGASVGSDPAPGSGGTG